MSVLQKRQLIDEVRNNTRNIMSSMDRIKSLRTEWLVMQYVKEPDEEFNLNNYGIDNTNMTFVLEEMQAILDGITAEDMQTFYKFK